MVLGLFFSGTGNSRHALEIFLREYEAAADTVMFSIEDKIVFADEIKKYDEIVFAYPVQYSTVPKILRDFVEDNKALWNGKKVFVIATMGLFSGDGAGILGRMLAGYGASVIGGLHLKMPDSIADEKVLKRSLEKNIKLVKEAEEKAVLAARKLKSGERVREGLGPICRIAGLMGQRLWFGRKTKEYSSGLKIDFAKCIGCGKCARLCPMENIVLCNGKATAAGKCTMCYRCVNICPAQAVTLLGKQVVCQGMIEKYL